MYHLQKITLLDTLLISEETKSLAEVTFMKKKIYYNMRIKTVQRIFSSFKKLVRASQSVRMHAMEREMVRFYDLEQELRAKKLQEIQYFRGSFKALKTQIDQACKTYTQKLVSELETGGNIKLEEGKGNEKWYVSCVDLIKSRFYQDEMVQYGIKDIQIKKVIRIHNRFLRNKFEEKTEIFQEYSNFNYKKCLEYLFYGIDPKVPHEINYIIEDGFRTSKVPN